MADLNADSKLDIAVTTQADSLCIFLGVGTATYAAVSSQYSLGNSVSAKGLTIGTFDSGTSNDIAVALSGSSNVAVLLNNGSGSFSALATYAATSSPYVITSADFNGDGKTDIATDGGTISVLLNTGTAFATHVDYIGGGGSALIAPDLNNDGKADLVSANYFANNCKVLLNNGSGVFANYTPYAALSAPQAIVTADFNQDKKYDIVACSTTDTRLSMFLGAGSGVFNTATTVTVGVFVNAMDTADFNKDGKTDLVTANTGTTSICVLLGNGNGTFGSATTYSTKGGVIGTGIRTGDVNKDGKADILVGDGNGDFVTYLGNGNGTFAAPTLNSGFSNNLQNQFKIADVTNDTKLDVVSANYGSNTVIVYAGNGSGGFSAGVSYTVATSPYAVAIGDLNNDGKLDMVTGNNNSNNEVSVLINSGSGFNTSVNYGLGAGSSLVSVVIADFNGDTKPDIAGSSQSLSVLLGTGTGTFGAASNFALPAYVNSMVAVDVNTDSKIDLVASSYPNDNIVVILNSGGPALTTTVSVNPVCKGSTVILQGGGAATYTWTSGVSDGTAFTPTITTTYTLTGTDNAGCTNTAITTVTVNPVPSLSITPTATLVCYGKNETLTASGASTYTWTNGIVNGVAFSPSVTATYTVTGTAANNCSNTSSIYITLDQPSIFISASAYTVCAGNPVTLNGNGASTYTWTGGVVDGNSFVPTASKTYSVTGTDVNNCKGSTDIYITVNQLPTVVAHTASTSVCLGSSTSVYGSGASNYYWSSGITNNVPFSPGSSQTYTVTGIDVNNCENKDTVSVRVNPLPVVTFTSLGFASPVCSNAGAQTLSGGYPNGGSYTGSGVVSNTTIFYPALAPGTYTLTYTYTDNNSCVSSSNHSVQVISCTTGIENNNEAVGSLVYPNPNNGQFYIQVGTYENTSVEVYNTIGQKVFAQKLEANLTPLDITNYNAGIYQITVLNNNVLLNQTKLVKQ